MFSLPSDWYALDQTLKMVIVDQWWIGPISFMFSLPSDWYLVSSCLESARELWVWMRDKGFQLKVEQLRERLKQKKKNGWRETSIKKLNEKGFVGVLESSKTSISRSQAAKVRLRIGNWRSSSRLIKLIHHHRSRELYYLIIRKEEVAIFFCEDGSRDENRPEDAHRWSNFTGDELQEDESVLSSIMVKKSK